MTSRYVNKVNTTTICSLRLSETPERVMTSTSLSGLVFVTSMVVVVTPEIVPVYWPHPCYDIFVFFLFHNILLSVSFLYQLCIVSV